MGGSSVFWGGGEVGHFGGGGRFPCSPPPPPLNETLTCAHSRAKNNNISFARLLYNVDIALLTLLSGLRQFSVTCTQARWKEWFPLASGSGKA